MLIIYLLTMRISKRVYTVRIRDTSNIYSRCGPCRRSMRRADFQEASRPYCSIRSMSRHTRDTCHDYYGIDTHQL